MKRYAADSLTAGRILGSFLLLFLTPLSSSFFLVYLFCGMTDLLDGLVARKTNTASRWGEVFDSAADFVFLAVMLVVFIPVLAWEIWMFWFIGAVAFIRAISLGIGAVKFRTVSSLHTYANKAVGILLFCFPFLYRVTDLSVTVIVVCGVALPCALEELIIIVCSRKLDRNVPGMLALCRKHRN